MSLLTMPTMNLADAPPAAAPAAARAVPLTTDARTALPLGTIADFALLRVAGLPLKALEDLHLPQSTAHVEQALRAERSVAAHRQAVADLLFAAVSRLPADANATRRRLLALRRDVHNGRPRRLDAEAREQVRNLLPPADRAAFDAWAIAQHELTAATEALDAGLQAEIQTHLRPALRRPLQVGTFRRGLAFASAGVERSALREKKLPTTPGPDNYERSLLGYLARAAAKTSPFSSFMSLAVLELAPHDDLPHPRAAAGRCTNTVNLNRGVVSRLHRLSRLEVARAADTPLQLNPTLAAGFNGRVHGLCNREVVLLGRPWWEQRWAQFKLDAALWRMLQDQREGPWSAWRRRLQQQGLDAPRAEATLAQLLERGVLLAPEPSDAYDEAPAARLRDVWQRSGSPRLQGLADALSQLEARVASLPTADGLARIDTLEQVRTAEAALRAALAPAAPAGTPATAGATAEDEALQNLVLEDCWLSGIEGRAGRALLAPLADLQRFLSGQVIVSPFYARLRAAFVERYGRGGRCDDAVGFLLGVIGRLVDIPEFGARLPVQTPVAAAPGVRIPVTAHVQIAAAGGARPARVVVNRVFDGAGWLAARFTAGDQPTQRALQQRLAHWLQTLSGSREPVDMPVAGHCNDLQAHRLLTPRVLRWPGEPVTLPAAQVVNAEDLRLVHDPRTDLLEVYDAGGRALNLLYLGTTFPSPIWGLRYALSILTQPYLLARPEFPPPAGGVDEPVRHEAAITQGALVLRRATWWLSAEHLRREWFAGTPAERLLRVRRECERHGIPPVFYAQRHIAAERTSLIPADVLNANRKPLWIDVRNPFWIAMLARIAEDGDWVVATEPMPSADGLWLEIDGQRHVCELQIEMLVEAGQPNARQTGARA